MTSTFLDAIRRATHAVRDGDTMDATRVIQDALSGNTPPASPAGRDDFDGVTIDGVVDAHAHSTSADTQDHTPPTAPPMQAQSYSGPSGARDYQIFVPPNAAQGVRGLVMMLHGCTQNPDDFARGTAMNDIALREGLIVVYPAQTTQHNPNSCWNWFEPSNQGRGAGEPAILAGLAQELAKVHDVPTHAIFAAGLSAGGAMAALLGVAYPDVFGAVGIHSGLPAGSAQDIPSAFAAMGAKGAGTAFALDPDAPPSRMMVVHGRNDRTVAPKNGSRVFEAAKGAFPMAKVQRDPTGTSGMARTRLVMPDRTVVAERWDIPSLAHAWSGGSSSGSFTNPMTPNASEGFVSFFLDPKML